MKTASLTSVLPIGNILDDIVKPDGKLVIFCGAEISISSGLLAAIPLVDEILNNLDIDEDDKGKLILSDKSMAMPFEMFIETFFENTNQHQLLNIFKNDNPSTNHFFIAKCSEHKINHCSYQGGRMPIKQTM